MGTNINYDYKALYGTSNQVYSVSPTLFTLATASGTTFTNLINPSLSINPIGTTVTITKITTSEKSFLFEKINDAEFRVSTSSTGNAFTNARAEDIQFTYTVLGAQNPNTNLTNTINHVLEVAVPSFLTTSTNAQQLNHNVVKESLLQIMTNFTRTRVTALKNSLNTTFSASSVSADFNNIAEPMRHFISMSSSRTNELISSLSNVCKDSFKYIIKEYISINNKYLSFDHIKNLIISSTPGFNNALYLLLKLIMLDNLDVDKIYRSGDDNSVLYFKKIVIEAFIKGCSSLVVYQFINAYTDIFIENGDFVNARISTLAACNMVAMHLQDLSTTNAQIAALHNNLIVAYININNSINSANVTDPTAQLNNLLTELHSLSAEATESNQDIQILKTNIRDNQMGLRNIIFNVEMQNKQKFWAVVEFWFLVALVLLILIGGNVLMAFKFVEITLIIIAFIAVSIILFRMVVMILNFMKFSK